MLRQTLHHFCVGILHAAKVAPETVLVVIAARDTLDVGTAKKPSAFFRSLCEKLTPVEFPYQSGSRLRRWVIRHFEGEGISIADPVLSVLLSRCPQDMTGLSGEIGKLIAYCHAHAFTEVTEEMVLRVTSPALREDAFALANAVVAGDRTAALAALDVHRKKKDDPILVLSGLSRVMSDLFTVSVMAEGLPVPSACMSIRFPCISKAPRNSVRPAWPPRWIGAMARIG